jgi:uncharacterized protein
MDNKQRDKLFNLSPTHRIAFAASCAERLFPNYVAFSRDASWGNPQQLREALDAVWSHLLGNPLTPSAARKLIKQCEPFVPDTEEVRTDLVSDGLDAGVAILEALSSCIDDNPEHAVDASIAATDTVDRHIQIAEGLDYMVMDFEERKAIEERIAKHPLMLREIKKQESDLQLLEHTPTINAALIDQLRNPS